MSEISIGSFLVASSLFKATSLVLASSNLVPSAVSSAVILFTSFLFTNRIAIPSGLSDHLTLPSAFLAAAIKVLTRVDRSLFLARPQGDLPMARFIIKSSPALRRA